jgi:hypothetical protein
MKTISIVLMLAIASPAFAQTAAESQSAPAQEPYGGGKPYIYDSVVPLLKGFSAPTPVTIGGVTSTPVTSRPAPTIELRPTAPQQPAPPPPKTGLG